MPPKKRPVIDLDKLRSVEQFRKRASDAQDAVIAASEALNQANLAAAMAKEEADTKEREVYAEEDAWKAAEALANHDAHFKMCDHVNVEIGKRRSRRRASTDAPIPPVDPESIRTVTIDEKIHRVDKIAELSNGHKGHGILIRGAHRFHLACGMSVDSPDDELFMERFEQRAPVNCASCLEHK